MRPDPKNSTRLSTPKRRNTSVLEKLEMPPYPTNRNATKVETLPYPTMFKPPYPTKPKKVFVPHKSRIASITHKVVAAHFFLLDCCRPSLRFPLLPDASATRLRLPPVQSRAHPLRVGMASKYYMYIVAPGLASPLHPYQQPFFRP